jgi:peptidase M28-like protein
MFCRGRCLPVLVGALIALFALPGCGSATSSSSSSTAPSTQPQASFDDAAAWSLVREQVEVGNRPAGSPQLRQLADRLVKLLPEGRFEPLPGEPGLRNVVGRIAGEKPALVIGAHYDTLKMKGFVGANNGAAGTAVVVEAARALAAEASAGGREIVFVLFDGEEPPGKLPETAEEFLQEALRGSRAYAKAHRDETGEMVLLDYVGGKGLLLRREEGSDPDLWNRLLAAAKKASASRYFSSETGAEILDDHTSFTQLGIPAIDLIDWRYPGHSLADGIDKMSPASLAAVGDTIVQLASEVRAE